MTQSYVYIITNKYRSTFYIGLTSSLERRIIQHKLGNGSIFIKKYNLKEIVYFDKFTDINQAILREKQLKNWHHEWIVNLIKEKNPKLETLDNIM